MSGHSLFPIFLNLKNRLCVVIGGGPVGRRKAHALLRADARVRLVCLDPQPADEVSPALEWLTAPYASHHLDGAYLAFAAAIPEVNRHVVADAAERGIMCNVASNPEAGDFFVPSTVRRGRFVLAIGTEGAAPALARRVRNQLENLFDDTYGRWVALVAELRPLVQEMVADPIRRRLIYESLCTGDWLERLRSEDDEAVRAKMLAEVLTLAKSGDESV